MDYIPDYLRPFIIHKDYFPELIEDSWFNNPVVLERSVNITTTRNKIQTLL